MFKIGSKYTKLQTTLELACNRLRLLQLKKLEASEKLKIEVANYLRSGKCMQAKLKAHRVIRDEAAADVMTLIEMHCELILERFELFKQMRKPDITLISSVTSLIWVMPYYKTHIEELEEITKQFSLKYGNKFCRMALKNDTGTADPDLIKKVKMFIPTDEETERCLRDVAVKYDIDYDKFIKNTYSSLSSKDSYLNDSLILKVEYNPLDKQTEFCADGVNQFNEPFSSKRVFTEIMSKLKIKKGSKLNPGTNRKSLSKSDSFSSNEIQSDLKDKQENHMKISPPICSPLNVPEELESRIHTERLQPPLYAEPPPPYNFQYIKDVNHGMVFNQFTFENYDHCQFPTCPSEILEPQLSNEDIKTKVEKE